LTAAAVPPARLKGFALAALFCASLARGDALTHLQVGATAPAFTARGADGKVHSLNDYAGKIVVLEWTSPVCPFTAVKYKSGAMQALQRYAAERRVVWLSIDTAASDKPGYLTATAARERIARTGSKISGFLFDVNGRIGRGFGAKTTPSFFIISRGGKLAYEGAMDDENSAGTASPRDYIRAALDDLDANRKVATPETQPYGCAIEY
jgi:AhpC/TSA family